MKKRLLLLVIIGTTTATLSKVKAQDPISLIIKEAVTRVIRAVDLKIQRLQTKTIWLQNIQKTIENSMSELKLGEITAWVENQRVLYSDYFDELKKVKSVLSYYYKIKEITDLQLSLVKRYKQSFAAIRQDRHFTPDEISYISSVYSGIIDESLKNLDGLYLAINSFATQMTDEKRLEIIESVRGSIQKNYDDLKRFSGENVNLSLARAKDVSEIGHLKELYGL